MPRRPTPRPHGKLGRDPGHRARRPSPRTANSAATSLVPTQSAATKSNLAGSSRMVVATRSTNQASSRPRARHWSVSPAPISHSPIASNQPHRPASQASTARTKTPIARRPSRRTARRIRHRRILRVAIISTTHTPTATPAGSSENPLTGQNTVMAPTVSQPGARRLSCQASRVSSAPIEVHHMATAWRATVRECSHLGTHRRRRRGRRRRTGPAMSPPLGPPALGGDSAGVGGGVAGRSGPSDCSVVVTAASERPRPRRRRPPARGPVLRAALR
ncbi:hypothetical protein LV79_003408 [Actinokineospora globicatena]|nr:hypothetical protein [Actinokineospora globicatena]